MAKLAYANSAISSVLRPLTRAMNNAVWGILRGVRVAIFFALLARVGRVFGGPTVFGQGKGTYQAVVIAELAGGVAGGLVVGLLRPFLTSGHAAALVGFIAGIPAAVLLRIGGFGLRSWTWSDAFAVVIVALAIGAPTGALLWYRANDAPY